jgi:hypothetical protein
MALVRDLAKMRNHLVTFSKEIPPYQNARAMGRGGLYHDHRRPSPRALAVIAEVTGSGQALMTHIDGMSAKNDAVLEGEMAELEGREERRVSLCHDCCSENARGLLCIRNDYNISANVTELHLYAPSFCRRQGEQQ